MRDAQQACHASGASGVEVDAKCRSAFPETAYTGLVTPSMQHGRLSRFASRPCERYTLNARRVLHNLQNDDSVNAFFTEVTPATPSAACVAMST